MLCVLFFSERPVSSHLCSHQTINLFVYRKSTRDFRSFPSSSSSFYSSISWFLYVHRFTASRSIRKPFTRSLIKTHMRNSFLSEYRTTDKMEMKQKKQKSENIILNGIKTNFFIIYIFFRTKTKKNPRWSHENFKSTLDLHSHWNHQIIMISDLLFMYRVNFLYIFFLYFEAAFYSTVCAYFMDIRFVNFPLFILSPFFFNVLIFKLLFDAVRSLIVEWI